MEFSYTVTSQGVRIDKVEEPGAVVDFPETIEGCPVTELGAYVLSGSAVEEIHLPAKLRKIGAYGFYGCRKLKRIYCYGRTLDLGAGLFADAGNVEFLDISLFDGEKSCFREMLSELRQTLRVRVHMLDADGNEREEMRLIFPEYYEESVENTPARILFIETHGCGHRYRYCFANREFQFRGYDELFPHVKVQESEELVTELALGRLLFPGGLSERYREMYLDYVKEHWKTAGKLFVEADSWKHGQVTNLDAGGIGWLTEEVTLSDGQLMELTGIAQAAGDTAAVSRLMDIRYERRRTERGANQSAAERPEAERKETGRSEQNLPEAGRLEQNRTGEAPSVSGQPVMDITENRRGNAEPETTGVQPRRKRRFDL